MKISKTSPMLHVGVTKKDPGLHFHFHVQNLFKFQSKLGLTEHENEHNKFKKKFKNEKPVHIILLCHILTITVHKQVINILELYIQPSDQREGKTEEKLSGWVKWGGLCYLWGSFLAHFGEPLPC